jgi:DNA-binding NarL/FixJ family response regulator
MESRGRIKVLIADDDASFAAYLVQLVEGRGLEVVGTVRDGIAAVDAAARLMPDVVLMDLDMPGLDGAAATREIVANHPSIKVVIISGSDVTAHIHDALHVGAIAHVRKAEVDQHLPPILDSLV